MSNGLSLLLDFRHPWRSAAFIGAAGAAGATVYKKNRVLGAVAGVVVLVALRKLYDPDGGA